MKTNRLAQNLREGKTVLGLCHMYEAPGIVEGMCTGWDFVWIDGQHGQFTYDRVIHAQRAAEAVGVETLLRVPSHEAGRLGLFADMAPSAIMAPMVNTVAEARAIVQAVRFAPLGSRSYGGRRVIDLFGRDYPTESELLVVAQIETPEAVENAEALSAVEGIDALFFGADDMRIALGLSISAPVGENPLREAMEKTARAARTAGKWAGCVAGTPETVRMAVAMGYRMIVGGGDIGFLRMGAAEKLAQLRPIANSGKE